MSRNSKKFAPLRRTQAKPAVRACDWPECEAEGEHRAPRSREFMKEYYWFCMDHVRQYNKSWNYYDGMTEQEVEADVRRDTTWHRPSWKLGQGPKILDFDIDTWMNDFGLRGEGSNDSPGERRNNPHRTPEAKAMAVLELEPPLTLSSLKQRYKKLVKLHHPDANDGDKESEERFKDIGIAYRVLMDGLNP